MAGGAGQPSMAGVHGAFGMEPLVGRQCVERQGRDSQADACQVSKVLPFPWLSSEYSHNHHLPALDGSAGFCPGGSVWGGLGPQVLEEGRSFALACYRPAAATDTSYRLALSQTWASWARLLCALDKSKIFIIVILAFLRWLFVKV